MRIWSLHPKYLDQKGLVALWRETLLAKKVLEGKTSGYKNHPQLMRFRNTRFPLESINFYLQCVWEESQKRNYNFDINKFITEKGPFDINVSKGQLEFEMTHLLAKLKKRDYECYLKHKNEKEIKPHPLFSILEGNVESWEKI